MTLLAAWATLLHRYTGEDDVVIGAPIANRTRAECQELIGFFVNTIALRIDLSDNPSFRTLLRRVREVTLGAYTYQDLPFEKLIEELKPERNLSHNPLFQVMFALQNIPTIEVADNAPPPTQSHNGNGTAKFDLTLAVVEGPWGLTATIEYNTDLFDHDRIVRMAGHLETLLAGIVADPDAVLSELPLLTVAERRRLLEEWNETATPYPQELCVHELFEAQAERTPAATAVICGQEELSYAALEDRANQLANYLRRCGIGPEMRVGVLVERSPELIVALLAVLKAGAVYTPLDPQYPRERLAYMLDDANVPLLLTQERLQPTLPDSQADILCLDRDWPTVAHEPTTRPPKQAKPDNAAYVLYTSGSTGTPKGVVMPHQPLVNHMLWMTSHGFDGTDVVLQRSPASFDASLWEYFAPLMVGARLTLMPEGGRTDTELLLTEVRRRAVTVIQLVPSLFELTLESSSLRDCGSLRRVYVGGEPLRGELVTRFLSRLGGIRLYNLYGLTEGCIDSTVFECHGGDNYNLVPIGRPIANVRVYLLDRYLQPVPVGVPGELCAGGVCVARGYLNQPGLTAERFVPDPFGPEPGGRLYRTGDLARYRSDGTIEYLGRLDQQVKLRGFRIELGEVEAVLGQHPAVQVAVCSVREYAPGDRRLVAYFVPVPGEAPSAAALRVFLARKLPEYMVPAAFVELASLPLSPNGKVDRRALPAPAGGRPELDAPFVAPRTATEIALAQIWAQILGVDQLGVHDNFFELGGHSLLATQVVAVTNDMFNVDVPLRRLFELPTVAGQAMAILQALADRLGVLEADRLIDELESRP